ncbi:hypothetical protein BST61_g3930 [Cercospora zeina]
MGTLAYAIPVGILAAIVVISLIFVWFWFPHAYKKGVQADEDDVNEVTGEERELQRQANRDIIERFRRARAMERGEIVEDVEVGEVAQTPHAPKTDTKTPAGPG